MTKVCVVLVVLALLSFSSANPLKQIHESLRILSDVVPVSIPGINDKFTPMSGSFTSCDQGSQCYNELLACSQQLKGPSDQLTNSGCSASGFSTGNTQAARDAYCTGTCYKTAFAVINALFSASCKTFFADTGDFGRLFLGFYAQLTAALEYTCTKNPNSGTPQYCSVLISTPPFSTLSASSFAGGQSNSTGCDALLGLGCCWQSTLNFLNSSGALSQFGASSNFAQYTYSTICQLSGVPACPVPGISTTYVQGTLAVRNFNIAYITNLTLPFVRRVFARVIYDSIVAQNPNFHITAASVVVTDISDANTILSRNFHTMSSNGVIASYYIQSSVPSENSNLATVAQQAIQNPVTNAFNQLPSSAKYNSGSAVAVNSAASSASATTTTDFSGAFSVVPSAISLAVALVALIAVAFFA